MLFFWNNSVKVEILGDSVYHIDAKIEEGRHDPWRLTRIYREAQTNLRHQAWDLLKGIATFSPLQLVCLGDFKLSATPKRTVGVANRSNTQIQ